MDYRFLVAGRVLLVEDDETLREVICSVLTEEGYDAVCVGSVSEAREFLAKERPACVLLDFHLPDGTAEDVISAMISATDCPPMCLVSASPVAPPVAERYRIPLVPKPFDIDAITDCVAVIIRDNTRPTDAG